MASYEGISVGASTVHRRGGPPRQRHTSCAVPNSTGVCSRTIKLVAAGGTSVFANDVGSGVTELQDSNFTIWDPRQFTLTIEDGSVWQVDQDAGVSQVTDLNGNFVKITPGGILHSSGTQVTFARDAQGRITAITDPDGQTMSYAYDGSGDLATYTDRQSNVTQFAYDDRHDLLQIQDPLGRLPVRNVYDASGRLLSTTDAAGSTVHYDADLGANQERVTDRLGHVTLYTYDAFGDITKKVDASGAVWNYTIDPRGNVLTETDPLGHTKTTTYDGADDVLTQTDALGNVTTSTYGAYRQLLTQTDALGHVTTSTYDASANVVSTTDALGNLTRYTYDAEGNRLSEVDPLSGVTQYVYDGAGHALEHVDAQGQVTSYQYGANGNKIDELFTHTNVDGSSGPVTTHTTYDTRSRDALRPAGPMSWAQAILRPSRISRRCFKRFPSGQPLRQPSTHIQTMAGILSTPQRATDSLRHVPHLFNPRSRAVSVELEHTRTGRLHPNSGSRFVLGRMV